MTAPPAGVAHTARGTYRTPCFMPVGTRGAVKYLSAADYDRLGLEIVLANTYHLMLRPGAEVVDRFGGVGRFAGWDGLTLTDSGGFQVFTLSPIVDDDGVTFRSVYDGSTHRLTPESAVAVQELLGADIQMVLDAARRCRARRRSSKGRRPHTDVGRTGLLRHRRWAVPLRHRARWHLAAAAPPAPRQRSTSTSTGTGSADSPWARPVPRCCRRSGPRRNTCRRTACAPHGCRGSGVDARGHRARGGSVRLRAADTPLGRHGTALTAAGKVQLKGPAMQTRTSPSNPPAAARGPRPRHSRSTCDTCSLPGS